MSRPGPDPALVEAAAIEVVRQIRDKERRIIPKSTLRYAERAVRAAQQRQRGWRWDLAITVEDVFDRRFWSELVGQRFGILVESGALNAQAHHELVELVVRAMRDEIETELVAGQRIAAERGMGGDLIGLLAERLQRPHPALQSVIDHLRRAVPVDRE